MRKDDPLVKDTALDKLPGRMNPSPTTHSGFIRDGENGIIFHASLDRAGRSLYSDFQCSIIGLG